MICAVCLREGIPLLSEADDLGKPSRAAGAAITIEHGTAMCLEHWNAST